MNIFIRMSTLCLFLASNFAQGYEERVLRVNQLFPKDWLYIPLIEPAIPADYVYRDDHLGMLISWGKKTDREEERDSNRISLSYSLDVIQTGPTTFSESLADVKELQARGVEETMKMRRIGSDLP